MNNNSRKLGDGRYVYYSWDDNAKAEVPHYLIPGENGVTDDLIVTLAAFDHDEALADRYADENADYGYRNYLAKAERGDGQVRNPIDEQTCRRWWTTSVSKNDSDKVKLVRSLLDSLTEDQINLIYEIFGERHTQKEIAEREGKSPQSVNNRLNKIKNRVKKLLAERGVTF